MGRAVKRWCGMLYVAIFTLLVVIIVKRRPLTVSSVHCDDTSCHVRGACLNNAAELVLYGDPKHTSEMKKQVEHFKLRLHSDASLAVTTSTKSPFSFSSQHAFVVDRYVDGNCGHILGDEIWSLLRLALSYQLRSRVETAKIGEVYLHRGTPIPCDEMFKVLAKELRYTESKQSISCHNNIYFGMYGISYVDGYHAKAQQYLSSENFSHDMRLLRHLFFKYAGVDERLERRYILLMHKKKGAHMSNIRNLKELSGLLSTRFPTYETKTVSWSDLDLKDQIKLLSQTRAMISLPGSDVMNAVFMPDNSTLIIFCRFVGGVIETSNEKSLWFDHLAYVRTVELCGEEIQAAPDDQTFVRTDVFMRMLHGLRI